MSDDLSHRLSSIADEMERAARGKSAEDLHELFAEACRAMREAARATRWIPVDETPMPDDGTRVAMGWFRLERPDSTHRRIAVGRFAYGRLWIDGAEDSEKVHPSHWRFI